MIETWKVAGRFLTGATWSEWGEVTTEGGSSSLAIRRAVGPLKAHCLPKGARVREITLHAVRLPSDERRREPHQESCGLAIHGPPASCTCGAGRSQ
jgi:hypothetical protein